MKVLVTGGAGFIGSNITEMLVREGFEVVIFDNFSLGSMDNLKAVKSDITVIRGDVEDQDAVRKATKGCDFVLHQAAASSSPMFQKNLKKCYSVNVLGTINVLEAARDAGVKRVALASTSSIYGNNKPPHKEDMFAIPPNFYAASKMSKEHLAYLFSQDYGLDTVVFRYLSIYGPHEKSKGNFANLVSQFLWTMQDGKEPVVYGDGKQTRDFVYVRDVARANLVGMLYKKPLCGNVFNVGTGRAYSLNELVAIINKLLGKKIKIKYIPNEVKNYINFQQDDTTKIKKVLGFETKYDLEAGIKEMVSSGV